MFMQDATRFVASNAILPVHPARPAISGGLVAGTLLETSTGWRAAETLRRGDKVHTFDGGLREVLALDHRWLMPGEGPDLICLPGGMLGNASDLMMLPGQHLMIDTWDAADLTDAISVLVPAATLASTLGIARVPVRQPIEIVTPLFAEEEVIWANSGLLLHCPAISDGAGKPAPDGFYPVLDHDTAAAILIRKQAALAA